jgi:hypothetical protein
MQQDQTGDHSSGRVAENIKELDETNALPHQGRIILNGFLSDRNDIPKRNAGGSTAKRCKAQISEYTEQAAGAAAVNRGVDEPGG